jgi:hypothetical protein
MIEREDRRRKEGKIRKKKKREGMEEWKENIK